MADPIIPGSHWRTEQVIRVPYRIEQHEEEQSQVEIAATNARFRHDPIWNRRFWSIQHVHDCIEGKTFHWFWSPMAEVFSLSQVMFMILPFAVYANDRGANLSVRGLILLALSLQLILSLLRRLLRWYHDWQFNRIPYRIIHR